MPNRPLLGEVAFGEGGSFSINADQEVNNFHVIFNTGLKALNLFGARRV